VIDGIDYELKCRKRVRVKKMLRTARRKNALGWN
jgi:hypothetical protein